MTEQEWKIFKTMPPAAQLDVSDEYAVAQYLRELISFNKLLVNDFDTEYNKLRDLLIKAGWSEQKLLQLVENGCKGTLYEREIPCRIKEQGDVTEYNSNKGRWKK